MIQFFQVLFLIAAVVLIVLNVLDYNKWQESRKEGSTKPHPIKWFNFILTSLVAIGCVLNIIVAWIRKG
jgi:phosphoglycerol transferase MdoB-like AlkP superfamily enzyme